MGIMAVGLLLGLRMAAMAQVTSPGCWCNKRYIQEVDPRGLHETLGTQDMQLIEGRCCGEQNKVRISV